MYIYIYIYNMHSVGSYVIITSCFGKALPNHKVVII